MTIKNKGLMLGVLLLSAVLSADDGAPAESAGRKESTGMLHDAKVVMLNRIVKKNIPREFDFDLMDIRVIAGIGADIHNLTIAENPAFAEHPLKTFDHFVSAENIRVRVNPLPLLIAHIHVTELAVKKPSINVIRTAENEFNFQDLFNAGKGPVLRWMRVSDMQVSDGVLRYIDGTAPRGPLDVIFDQIALKAFDFSLKEDFDVQVWLRTPAAKEQNVYVSGKAGPLLDAEKFEQVPVNVLLKVDQAPIVPYLDFAPEGLTAYPVQGHASIDFSVVGNLWDGVRMKGAMHVNDVVLANEEDTLRGVPANIDITVPEDITLSLANNRIDIGGIDVVLNGNPLKLKGKISEIMTIPQVDVDIEAQKINIVDMIDIYPFAKAYIPDGSTYGGHAGVNIHAKGDYNVLAASGTLNMDRVFFSMQDLVAKQAGSEMRLRFDAELSPTEATIKARAGFNMMRAQILQTEMFVTGLEEMRKRFNLSREDIGFLQVNARKPLDVDRVFGDFEYRDEIIHFRDVKVQNLHQGSIGGIDAVIEGQINTIDQSLNVTGRMQFSPAMSARLVGLNPQFRKLMNGERVEMLVAVEGPVEDPVVRLMF